MHEQYLKGGGIATFLNKPDTKTVEALNVMVQLARAHLKNKYNKMENQNVLSEEEMIKQINKVVNDPQHYDLDKTKQSDEPLNFNPNDLRQKDKVDRPLINFRPGFNYVIDGNFANGGIVRLIEEGSIYCIVQDLETGNKWETMKNRLSVIPLWLDKYLNPKLEQYWSVKDVLTSVSEMTKGDIINSKELVGVLCNLEQVTLGNIEAVKLFNSKI